MIGFHFRFSLESFVVIGEVGIWDAVWVRFEEPVGFLFGDSYIIVSQNEEYLFVREAFFDLGCFSNESPRASISLSIFLSFYLSFSLSVRLPYCTACRYLVYYGVDVCIYSMLEGDFCRGI